MPGKSGEASLHARIAALERWAKTEDRVAATAPARAGLNARFEREVDPKGELDPAELARRVEAKRRAHFTRLALKSAQSRRQAAETRRALTNAAEARQTAAELEEAAAQLYRDADAIDDIDGTQA
jgi:hypothetical protein